jgi:hypothetical protein
MTVFKRVLLVEGKDDLHILASLFKHHDVPEVFTLSDMDGIERLLDALPVQLKASAIERVGVVVDADVDIAARWNAIRGILASAGYLNVTGIPEEGGTILRQAEMPDVVVWLMPNNRVPGMVEDFAAFLIPEDDRLSDRAFRVIDEIPAVDRRFTVGHRSKAHIHTWLSWQADPGTPMGLAITKKYLNADAAVTAPFLDWIYRLLVR